MNSRHLPNIPWQDQPANCTDIVWRYSANPIIPRDLLRGCGYGYSAGFYQAG